MKEYAASREWIPFRTEWSIFSEICMVAGQIDAVFWHSGSNKFHMVDWKRVKDDLDPEANIHVGKFGLGPCEHLVDNKWSHYAAQQKL